MPDKKPDQYQTIAAQLWCLPQHGSKEMDCEFAQSIADALKKCAEEARREAFLEAATDGKLLEIGRRAIEDTAIEFRESRISELGRGNGIVVKEKDGEDSSIIRFGPELALTIGLKAMARADESKEGEGI